jgi:ABC-type antimicrobial peptide transport system permease subunit
MTFAGLALLLAMVGVFGIFAYAVQQRVRDFGVRRALGATTSDVLRLVVGGAVRVIATGAVLGLALSTVMGRLLATMLFGVQPLDPMTFASVTIVLTSPPPCRLPVPPGAQPVSIQRLRYEASDPHVLPNVAISPRHEPILRTSAGGEE